MKQDINKLVPGMKLENDIFLENSNLYLFPKGKVLSNQDIKKLEEKNIKQVFIDKADCTETFFPIFQRYARKVVRSKKISDAIELAEHYEKFVQDVSEFSFDMASYTREEYSADAHRVHVANMAVALATVDNRSRLKNDKIEIKEMAEAALLCDIGRCVSKSPELFAHLKSKYEHQLGDFQQKLPQLPSDLFEYYQPEYHSFYSYLLLKDYPVSSRVLDAVLYSHESVHGKSGYLGTDITGHSPRERMSKILKVCEFYDMLLYRGKDISPNAPFRGISKIMVTAASTGAIDSEFTERVLKVVPLYPIGSKVVLNDGTCGEVVYYKDDNVAKPVVKTELEELIEINSENPIIGFDVQEDLSYRQALM